MLIVVIDARLDFCFSLLGELNRLHAMAAFVVFGPLQFGLGLLEVLQGSLHMRLLLHPSVLTRLVTTLRLHKG